MSSPPYSHWLNNALQSSAREPARPGLNIYGGGKRVPSSRERQDIFRRGGVTVNLDSNWAPQSAGGRTAPMVVIPNRATPEMRTAAQRYADRISKLYNSQFGTSYKPTVKTRRENGRGRPATIHTEPYALTDTRAHKFFNSPEGKSKYADILRSTLGSIPGAQFSLPHNPARGDYGAYGSGTNEVERARGLIGMLGGSRPQQTNLLPNDPQIVYGQGGEYNQSQPTQSASQTYTGAGIGYRPPEGQIYPYGDGGSYDDRGAQSQTPPAVGMAGDTSVSYRGANPLSAYSRPQQQQTLPKRPQLPTPNPQRPSGATWVSGSDGMQPLFASDATPQQLREHFPQGGQKFGNIFKGLFK